MANGDETEDDPEFARVMEEYNVILRLIGEVVTKWASLDDRLIWLLSYLAGCEPQPAGVIYYALNAFSTRYEVIKALAQHSLGEGEPRDHLLPFLDQLSRLATVRNDIVHAVYKITIDASEAEKKRKITIEKHVFRSQRKELHQKIKAQTGELVTHCNKLDNAVLFLVVFNFLASGRPRPDQKLLEKLVAFGKNVESGKPAPPDENIGT